MAGEMMLKEVHRQTLLEIDGGMKRFPDSYPPALDLVREGYCAWRGGNPASWDLELTPLGVGAVALIKCPEADAIDVERVDNAVCRLSRQGEVIGFAVRQPNGRWAAYDEHWVGMSQQDFASPDAVALMLKMYEAEITLSCREAVLEDSAPSMPRF